LSNEAKQPVGGSFEASNWALGLNVHTFAVGTGPTKIMKRPLGSHACKSPKGLCGRCGLVEKVTNRSELAQLRRGQICVSCRCLFTASGL